MPYYLYKISTLEGIELVKNLELLDQFESFREAGVQAKKYRAESDEFTYKVMFAENQLSAEEQLMEKRKKPILMEHER